MVKRKRKPTNVARTKKPAKKPRKGARTKTKRPTPSERQKQISSLTNLNRRFSSGEILTRQTPVCTGDTTILFDNIAEFLNQKISAADSVILISPFFTSATPLKSALEKKRVTLVTAPSKGLTTQAQKQLRSSWSAPAIGQSSKLFTLSAGRGRTKSLAHCKYVVGFDSAGDYLWATCGSYNITGGSPSNLESLICFDQVSHCCKQIVDECFRILRISQPRQ